jgi:hypothetical protein
MDVHAIIAELRAELERLNEIIETLERLCSEETFLDAPKRRGRKSMDDDARLQVSKRMKRYWAQRRKEQAQPS